MKYQNLTYPGYQEIKEHFRLGDIASKILASKGCTNKEISQLLSSKESTNDFSLDFLDAIILRIQKAKEKEEKILICGDYDCDGICATTILYDALLRFGCNVGYYIPNRFLEGYGVNKKTMELAVEKSYHIVITVDNGVKATEALNYARKHNICVILSDHHSYDEKDLSYDYFLHPNVCPPFFKDVSGAGLAYLLSKRLIGNDPFHTALAAIATIGDMVGAKDANRVIIKEGISLLNRMYFPPIVQLADDQSVWTATKIAFQLVPKINALGRLADRANVNTLVKYFLIREERALKPMTEQIKGLNNERKQISIACETIALSLVNDQDDFHVLYDENFHEGLNGIVAAKVANKYHRPTMVLSKHRDILKGSIRSVGVDLTSFFDGFKDHLVHYGGHKMAAGIAIKFEDVDALKGYCAEQMKVAYQEESKQVLLLDIADITIEEVEATQALEPFGSDFEKPLFRLKDQVKKLMTLSNGLHLKFISSQVNYLYFNRGVELTKYSTDTYSFIGDLSINEFRNNKSITMIVEDIIK